MRHSIGMFAYVRYSVDSPSAHFYERKYCPRNNRFITSILKPRLLSRLREFKRKRRMSVKSRSDIFYRRFILSRFFTKGWGDLNAYKRFLELRDLLVDRGTAYKLVSHRHPVQLEQTWTQESCFIAEGHFISPVATRVPGLLPRESERAYFQIVVPKRWHARGRKPVCIHLAGTGDHYFWRRRNLMAKPLVKESGIASVILESPYYGLRKPKGQARSSLRHVVDLFIMGASLVLESLVLFHWCERQGYGPLAVSGISMGGHMASLAATAWPKPLAVVPCLSWSTASSVFTQVQALDHWTDTILL